MTHSKTEEKELSSTPLPQKGNFEFRWLKDEIAYVAIKTFDDAFVVTDFELKLTELRKAKKIILDIRNNGGGSGKNSPEYRQIFRKNGYDLRSKKLRQGHHSDRKGDRFIPDRSGYSQWKTSVGDHKRGSNQFV